MTDETREARFERDLRSVLAAAEPADAPAVLYTTVAQIPLGARSRSRRGWASGRMVFAGLAMAAVVLVAVAAAALVLRPWGGVPIVGGPTAAPVSPAPAAGGGIVVTYRIMPVNKVEPGPKDIEAVIAVLQARIAATLGTATSIVSSGAPEITVRVAIDTTDEAAVNGLRELLAATGRLDFVPLGDTPASTGDRLDVTANPPLFSDDQVATAKIGSDQTGARTVDFTLRPEAARQFADYTAANVATYFAIVLDGEVISAPVINSSIPNGEMQITQGGVGGYPLADAQRLVAIVQSGPLPFPIVETAFEVAPAVPGGPALVTPVPSDLVLRTASRSPTLSPAAVDPGAPYPDAKIDGTSLGEADAPVKMEVYGDFQCPVCATHTLDIEPTLVAEYVQAGDLRITHLDIDLLGRGGDESKTTAIGGYCAVQQGKYWDYAHWILANQDGEAEGGFRQDRVVAIATAAGLDAAAFSTCLDSPQAAAEVAATTTKATGALEIDSVPTIYLDGTRYVGLRPASDWSALIDAELAGVNASSTPPTPSGITAP